MSIITKLPDTRYYTAINPYLLPGLSLWLDGSRTSSVTAYPGSVSTWADLSGKANDATQATGANQPTSASGGQNNRSYISFDGVDDFLNLPSFLPDLSNGAFTLFLVGVSNNSTAGVRFYSTASNQRVYLTSTGSVVEATFGPPTQLTLTSSVSALSPFIAMMSTNGITNVCTLKVNNGTALTGSRSYTGAPSAMVLGSGASANFLNGSIYEVIITSNIVSTANELSVFQYLSSKWKISIS